MESSKPVEFVLYRNNSNTYLIDRIDNGESIRVCTTSSRAIADHLMNLLTRGDEYAKYANENVPWDS
jgi:hypothetical protein